MLEDIYAYYWSNVKNSLFLGMTIVPLSYVFAFMVLFTLVLGKKPIPRLAVLILACFLPICCFFYAIKVYTRFVNFIKSINERWPTEAEQSKLRDDFAGSRRVCNGAMRIGNDYSYFLIEHQIIDTQKIISFRTEEKHFPKGYAVYMYAAINDTGTLESGTSPVRRDFYVTVARNQKLADALINEATFALKCTQ